MRKLKKFLSHFLVKSNTLALETEKCESLQSEMLFMKLSFKMLQSSPNYVKYQIVDEQGELHIRKDMSHKVIKVKGKQYDAEETTLWNTYIQGEVTRQDRGTSDLNRFAK